MIFDWIEEIDALIRQESLTHQLGQVACRWANEGEDFEQHSELAHCNQNCSVCKAGYAPACPGCGAVV